MKKILAFAGSNSSKSINQQLVKYAASLLEKVDVTVIDLREYDAPMYSQDIEENDGFPEIVRKFNDLLKEYDGYIIASPEHNGGMPAFLKNIIDWQTRIGGKEGFLGKNPVLLLSSSPGGLGGANNLKNIAHAIKYWGGESVTFYSLGGFYQKFTNGKITDQEEQTKLVEATKTFEGQF